MSEWERGTLEDVLVEVDDRNADGAATLVLSVTEGRGIVPQTEVFRKRIATDDTTKYKVVQPLDIAWNPYLLWTGAVGQWLGSEPGVTSPVYPIFRTRPDQDARFWGLVLGSGVLTPYFDSTAVGSIQRRRRTTLPVFNAATVSIPPVADQRRIADVIAAVDAQIEALEAELGRARATLARTSTDIIDALPETRALGEFTETRSGPSYAAADVATTSKPGSVPVIGIPNTKPDGSLDLSEIGYVTGLAKSVATIDEASLVLIRTNGNRQRIGNVYLPPAEAHGHAVSAFQFLMKVDDPLDREFVYWLLREPSMQTAMSEAASGTTGLGNLAVRWLNATEVPWSDNPDNRAAVVAPLRALQDAIDGLSAELRHLRAFRSTLLTALLSQEIEVPESYDALLEPEMSGAS